MGELAGRPVQRVAWKVWQQVGQPGGLDRGVGGGLAGLIGQDGQEPRSCIHSFWRRRFWTTPWVISQAYQQVRWLPVRISCFLLVFRIFLLLGLCIPRWVKKKNPRWVKKYGFGK